MRKCFTRFAKYPRGSVMLFQSSCRNCHELERKIIKLFTSKYILRSYFGREYFEGDQRSMIGDLCDIVKNEGTDAVVSNIIADETIQEVIADETIQEVIADETIQDIIADEIIQETIADEIIQETIADEIIEDIIADENIEDEIIQEVIVSNIVVDETIQNAVVDFQEETIQDIIVSNMIEDDIEEYEEDLTEGGDFAKQNNIMSRFCCVECKFFTDTNCHLKQHLLTKKHLNKTTDQDTLYVYKCEKCDKSYQTKSGLWKHVKSCNAPEITPIVATPEVDLHAKIDNLEKMIIELVASNK
jgi:hypothetical protein